MSIRYHWLISMISYGFVFEMVSILLRLLYWKGRGVVSPKRVTLSGFLARDRLMFSVGFNT